eukprot:5108605-Lingulodinium_polyedra.AAC.1
MVFACGSDRLPDDRRERGGGGWLPAPRRHRGHSRLLLPPAPPRRRGVALRPGRAHARGGGAGVPA